MTAATHRLIAKHAVMFAREAYEAAALYSNAFYREWPVMDAFCRANWPMFVPDVREVFVDLLALPDEDHPDWGRLADDRKLCKRGKAEIHEALCYDGAAKVAGASQVA
jgi:hypothetical protein